jgi:ubiquinone/menaquinone biosynthesis C-methylase UbiE
VNEPNEYVPVWDNLWTKLAKGSGKGRLYTAGKPNSLDQINHRCYFEDLWHLLGSLASKLRYLELGAGRGTTSMYLASRGCDVTMVDVSAPGFELAKVHFAAEGLKDPSFVLADARNTGLPAESWDCVYSIGLLEHFKDPVPILRESLRLLRPQGLLFHVIVPTVPPSHSLPIRLILNPFVTTLRASKQALKAGLGLERSSPSPEGEAGALLRTDYSRQQYLSWMMALPARCVECLPYNPYHQIYSSPTLEGRITVRLYRWHYTLKKTLGMYPLLHTFSGLALCDLLIARKDQQIPSLSDHGADRSSSESLCGQVIVTGGSGSAS